MKKKSKKNNSIAIPVELNVQPSLSTKQADVAIQEFRQKYGSFNSTIENSDLVGNEPSKPLSLVVTEEELTGELPSGYGETIIVMHVRDPHWAWVYWEYSAIERKKLEQELGIFEFAHSEFLLRIVNDTMGYIFDIKLPEGSDNWYVSLNDADCDYRAMFCVSIPSEGVRVLATSSTIHTPKDKASDRLAVVVPGKPVVCVNKSNEAEKEQIVINPDCFTEIPSCRLYDGEVVTSGFIGSSEGLCNSNSESDK